MPMAILMLSGAGSSKRLLMSSLALYCCFLLNDEALYFRHVLVCFYVYVQCLFCVCFVKLSVCFQLSDPKAEIHISPARDFLLKHCTTLVSLLQGSALWKFSVQMSLERAMYRLRPAVNIFIC